MILISSSSSSRDSLSILEANLLTQVSCEKSSYSYADSTTDQRTASAAARDTAVPCDGTHRPISSPASPADYVSSHISCLKKKRQRDDGEEEEGKKQRRVKGGRDWGRTWTHAISRT